MCEKYDRLFYDNFYESYHVSKVCNFRCKIYEVYGRIADIIIALFVLLFGIPIVLLFGLAVVLETKGPAIYTQIRVGKDGRLFRMYKLRSMYLDSEKHGAKWAERNDSRVTRVGRFIRRMRIDEIPQLFNVLKGEMSIIGPRPERPMYTMEFNNRIPGFTDRLRIKPGLTGWAQVNGGYDITPEEKLSLDMFYIDNRCIKLDFLIILKTIRVIVTGEGAR